MSVDMYDYYVSLDESYENEENKELEVDEINYEYYLEIVKEIEIQEMLYQKYLQSKSHHCNDDLDNLNS